MARRADVDGPTARSLPIMNGLIGSPHDVDRRLALEAVKGALGGSAPWFFTRHAVLLVGGVRRAQGSSRVSAGLRRLLDGTEEFDSHYAGSTLYLSLWKHAVIVNIELDFDLGRICAVRIST